MSANKTTHADTKANARMPWVEPAVHQLHLRDTAYNPGTGGDPIYSQYHDEYPDCTRS